MICQEQFLTEKSMTYIKIYPTNPLCPAPFDRWVIKKTKRENITQKILRKGAGYTLPVAG
jgi:hypothetical protein